MIDDAVVFVSFLSRITIISYAIRVEKLGYEYSPAGSEKRSEA